MSEHESISHKDSDPPSKATADAGDFFAPSPVYVPDINAGAPINPDAPDLTHDSVQTLQNTHGNRFVQRLLQRVTPLAQSVQRRVIRNTAQNRDAAAILAMTLEAFHQHAQDQVDWHSAPGIDDTQRQQFMAVLHFTRRSPSILAGCRTMPVNRLLAAGLVKGDFSLEEGMVTKLLTYSQGVSGEVDTVPIRAPTNDPLEAMRMGEAMKKLMDAPDVGGVLIHLIMRQQELQDLLNRNLIDDFIKYVQQCAPRLEAPEGKEIQSYIALRDEGVDPVAYNATPLRGKVRNFHRFQRAALDRLITNFNRQNVPNDQRKPLTLILHTALDHNGAFHRDAQLTNVITNNNILTLMIEGAETMAQVQAQIQPLAQAYGRDGRIDQTMFAGHGNARSIELAGPARFRTATATADHTTTRADFVPFSTGDTITVMEFYSGGFARGYANGRTGYFPINLTSLAGDATAIPQSVDLDNAPMETTALFDELLRNMANDPATAPHRRIVFNACLTGSNTVTTPLDANEATAQAQVRDEIRLNASLATFLQDRARARGLNTITVLGANGSIGVVRLLDSSDGLTIISGDDPAVTSDKLTYVAQGTEPQGVLRAVLECWAGYGAADVAQRQQQCFQAMQTRIATPPTGWAERIIHVLFNLILTHYRTNGEKIRLMGDAAGTLSEMVFTDHCRVSALLNSGLEPGGALGGDAVPIFNALTPDAVWTSEYHVPLVTYQVWLKHDATKRANFMQTLQHFDCQTAAEFLDIAYLGADIPFLIPISAASTREQILLAFRIIDTDPAHAHTRTFLLRVIGTGNRRFPTALNVGDIAQGNPDEQTVLGHLGLVSTGGTPSPSSTGEARQANLDLDNDGTNETFVEPTPGREGEIAPGAAIIYRRPDIQSTRLGMLAVHTPVEVVGQTVYFYAIRYSRARSGVGFVRQNRCTLR